MAHPRRCSSRQKARGLGGAIWGIWLGVCVLPVNAGQVIDQPRPHRMILKLESPNMGAGGITADPISASGLDSMRQFINTVRPLVPSPADPELARQTGLDRYFVITLEAGIDAESLLTMASNVAGSSLRSEYGAKLVDTSQAANSLDVESQGASSDPIDVPGSQPVNDPLFPQQWALRNTGQNIDGLDGIEDADVDAPSAWALASGNVSPVVVAVLDSGVSSTHPDLVDNLVPGFNAADGDPSDTNDLNFSHGTGCAGIIAADHNNLIGVAGVAGNAQIMPVRIFNSFGFGYEAEFVAGLVFAADNGASVVSMSIGYPFYSDAMYAAVEYAHGRDVVLVSSTGNINGQDVQFPALMEQTIAVGATNNQDEVWANSTRGPELTLVAPGVDILSTWDTADDRHAYRRQTGTSFAVPIVAGVAALVRGIAPDLTNDEVAWVLINSCINMGEPGWDADAGYGRINAADAVARALTVRNGACQTDIDGDGQFTIDDIEAFIEAFIVGDPITDLVAPFGTVDQDDLTEFVDQVIAGCSGSTEP